MSKRKKKSLLVSLLSLLVELILLPFRLIAAFFRLLVPKDDKEQSDAPSAPNLSYKSKYLLTKHEWTFYQKLKPLADQLGLVVLAKIRVADLVEPVAADRKEYMSLFAKIKSKHIDFVLCRPENLKVELLIELDDSTHIAGNERDTFIEALYAKTGYRLFRTYNDVTLTQLQAALCVA